MLSPDVFIIKNTKLVTLTLPSLVSIAYSGNADPFEIHSNHSLKTISAPLLSTANSLWVYRNNNLKSILLPELSVANRIYFNASKEISFELPKLEKAFHVTLSGKITSVSFPELKQLGSSSEAGYMSVSSPLMAFSVPKLSTAGVKGINLSFISNFLPSSMVNSILAELVKLSPFTKSTIDLRYQTPLAPPTGQGIVDKNLLIANGNSVLTD